MPESLLNSQPVEDQGQRRETLLGTAVFRPYNLTTKYCQAAVPDLTLRTHFRRFGSLNGTRHAVTAVAM